MASADSPHGKSRGQTPGSFCRVVSLAWGVAEEAGAAATATATATATGAGAAAAAVLFATVEASCFVRG
jgi:hypothetical protein